MRLTARSLLIEPSFSLTRALGWPKRPCLISSTATRSPSCASIVAPAGISISRPASRLLTGTSRPPPFGSARNTPIWRWRCAIQHLDDAAAVADRVAVLAALLGAGEHAVADAGDFNRPRFARNVQADARRFAMRLAVPFGRNGDQLAVRVALGHVGEHDRRAGCRRDAASCAAARPFRRRQARAAPSSAPRGRCSSARTRARSRARRPCPCACR